VTLAIGRSRDIAACLALRRAVFIEEQGVSEADEQDGRDSAAIHLLARLDGRPVGTARLLVIPGPAGGTGKIGRVCVLPEARGAGIGAALVRAAVAEFRAMPGIARVTLGSQLHAAGFYQRLGFAAEGAVYRDAGIDHRDMVLLLGPRDAGRP
jgi:ElaA protein